MSRSICDSRDELLGKAANEYFEAVARGERPSIDDYAQRYPMIADDICRVFPALALVRDSTAGGALVGILGDGSDRQQLGDYRIVRELGRGGMGIVYEAEQLSLGRRVALKVLPFAAVMDEKAIVRFKNEARAAATLDHPNIVPIHAVGNDRGVYFYAMSLIEGRTLEEIINQLRGINQADASRTSRHTAGHASTLPAPSLVPSADTTPVAALSTLPAFESRQYCRSAASLAVQAARALHHAHERGIVHRDIKPGNLMVSVTGKLWITDFGLARISSDAGLTMTGDLLGTIRYMAPEQALGEHVVVDHRADVYSLGVTLYELLTLRPTFAGNDRATILKNIAVDTPISPRTCNAAIPIDLETIVIKAIAKEPSERYQSAADFADDLERLLDNKPIVARPPTYIDRATKWFQRRTPLVVFTGLALLVLSVVLVMSLMLLKRSESRAIAALEANAGLLYRTDMTLAFQTFEKGWSDEVQMILDRYRPKGKEPDRRGFEWQLLQALVQPPVSFTLSGHQGAVNELAVFPDRKRFASVGDDGTLRLWDVRARRLLKTINICGKPLYSLAISPDGKLVAAGSDTLYLCELEAGERLSELFHSETNLESITFSPDGQHLVTGSRYHEVSLLSLDGRLLKRVPCGALERSLEYVPGSQLLLVPSRRTTDPKRKDFIQIWDASLSDVQQELELKSGSYVGSITVARSSPCGRFVAAGAEFLGKAFMFDVASGRVLAETAASRDNVHELAYSPDGKGLALGYRNGRLEYFKLELDTDGLPIISLRPITMDAHRGAVKCLRFLDSSSLASCGTDGLIRVCDTAPSGATDFRISDQPVNYVQLSPDGRLLLCTTRHELIIADAERDEVIFRENQPTEQYTRPAWSRTGNIAAVAYNPSGTVLLLDRAGRTVLSIAHGDWVDEVTFSPDGAIIAIIGPRQLQLCHANDGAEIIRRKISNNESTGSKVAYSLNGAHLAYSVRSSSIAVLNVDEMHPFLQLSCESDTNCLAFSPDDKLIASGHDDSKIRLWDVKTGRMCAELVGHARPPLRVVFSPDGRTLLSGGRDGLRVWSVDHRQSYGVVIREPNSSVDFSLSSDNGRLAVGYRTLSNDRPNVRVWSIQPIRRKQ